MWKRIWTSFWLIFDTFFEPLSDHFWGLFGPFFGIFEPLVLAWRGDCKLYVRQSNCVPKAWCVLNHCYCVSIAQFTWKIFSECFLKIFPCELRNRNLMIKCFANQWFYYRYPCEKVMWKNKRILRNPCHYRKHQTSK